MDDLEGVFVGVDLVEDFLQLGCFFYPGPGRQANRHFFARGFLLGRRFFGDRFLGHGFCCLFRSRLFGRLLLAATSGQRQAQ